jgi:MarR family transcriptional regulator, transcriptional regulator for hemolysin
MVPHIMTHHRSGPTMHHHRQQQLRDKFAPLIARAARQWRRAVDRRLQPFGLTEATWLPLIYLARAPVPMRQKDLAAALTLDGSSVVRLLDALVAAELVERREEDGDRRARIIVPTKRGLSIADQVEAVAREVRTATLSGLSDHELEISVRVLQRVCASLADQQDPDA